MYAPVPEDRIGIDIFFGLYFPSPFLLIVVLFVLSWLL